MIEGFTIAGCLKLIAVLGSLGAMIYGMRLIFLRLKEKNQGFGPNSLKALGMVLFMPTLILLSLLTDFSTESLAALLGTIAGYTLASSGKTDGSGGTV